MRNWKWAWVALMVWSSGCSDGNGPPAADSGVGDGAVSMDSATLGELGDPCAADATCGSGHCVDDVCCDTACDSGCATCSAAGLCGAAPLATECRAAAGGCDVAESCDGVSLSCPSDEVVAAEVVCRASLGSCDVEEVCDGSSASCPADQAAAAGAVCGDYRCLADAPACPTSCVTHADCVDGLLCANSACIAAKWAFLSFSSFTANLGGLTGADAFCQASANVVGLPGTYLAWLADGTGSPASRFTESATPYVMPTEEGGAIVLADNWADLTDGTLDATFSRNEFGQWVTAGDVFSNVSTSGELVSSDASCAGWTSTLMSDSGGRGAVNWTNATWTVNGSAPCNQVARLFCLQQ